MAHKVSDEERERIIALFPSGLSCNEIAKQFNRSPDTVHRIAKSVGHVFGYTNARNAQETNRAYGAERRANIRLTTAGLLEETLGEFTEPTLVYNFGGKDNDYNQRILDKPDARTKRDLAQTAATLWRIIKEIDAAEQGKADVAGLETIFRQLDKAADEYDSQSTVQPEAGGGNQPDERQN